MQRQRDTLSNKSPLHLLNHTPCFFLPSPTTPHFTHIFASRYLSQLVYFRSRIPLFRASPPSPNALHGIPRLGRP